MLLQDTDDDARIGHARDFDVVQVICDTEALSEGQFKRMHACTARVDEGAIDIEKEKALSQLRFWFADFGLGLQRVMHR